MKFTGVMPALITPLTAQGELNKPVLKKLMEDLMAQGADGFYLGGATGEGIIISKEVHKELTTEAIKIVNGRVPCIVHVARMHYPEMIELAKHAQAAGADAISAMPPLFYDYTNEDIYRYYEGLSNVVDIPIMIYNNPSTGVQFSAEQVAELCKIKNVSAIKWTNYESFQITRIKQLTGGNCNVINGPDDMLLCGLAAGADGGIGTTYNFLMPQVKALYNAFHAGDLETARRLQVGICDLIDVYARYNFLLVLKVILEARGYDLCYPMYPIVDYTPEEKAKILAEMQAAGLVI